MAAEIAADPMQPAYEIRIDSRQPAIATVDVVFRAAPARLTVARGGDGAGISGVRCNDGRIAIKDVDAWRVPLGCKRFTWTVALDDIDAGGIDASLPVAAYSKRHSYWLLPERGALLRGGNNGGSVEVRLRLADGRVEQRRYSFPALSQPPFVAVIGAKPSQTHVGKDFTLRAFGDPPSYAWMGRMHQHVLTRWSAWRRDIAAGSGPKLIDWIWVKPPTGSEPGYTASAGAEAIVSQLVTREGDPNAEAKARVVVTTSAAHEGFHMVTGYAGQAWPAWVNESFANHFAIEAARDMLAPDDHRWLDAFYIDPEVRSPLLVAQAKYSAGDTAQAQVFYIWGARFWREIEKVLTVPPNESGRLAALIKQTDNFAGVDLADAEAVATFLDRYSEGRSRPIVLCFLKGQACPSQQS